MSQAVVVPTDKLSITKKQQGCYVFSRDQLTAISATIQKHIGKLPTVTIELMNERSITSDNIDELLKDPFIESSRISSISYSVFEYNIPNRVSVRLRETWMAPVSYEISGERNVCLALEQSITSVIGASKKWYTWINVHNYPGLLQMAIVFPLAAGVGILVALPFSKAGDAKPPGIFFFVFAALIFGIPWASGKVIPKTVFNFGRGRIVYERISSPPKWFFSAIILGLLATFFRDEILTAIKSFF
ncbi:MULTISPECIES: hypothetical protein [unclassified Mesorhizobium]|uniref:hypothetical protein n=1 Tax=unclassified Mesorhizobium TaxID=325217 RepID=UPI000FCB327D|nr:MULTISPECIES: hypothetical protein [unclassified Mesorhizobium]RUX97455.1 hypothetical protein EN993_03905 [Mesorhizobium sp. M7D.F.Ca.US.004.01.2.1]RVA36641.1 hypothetical protein EN935_01715 [Mesorhizobium sp. M7D.F.Ca.US.004.03.1.1]